MSFSNEEVLGLASPRMLTYCVTGGGDERVVVNYTTTQMISTILKPHEVNLTNIRQ